MNTQIEYVRPDEIEKRSFEIIGRELEQRGIVLDALQEPVTKRVIHTTADFDYADTLVYSENAVEKARNLIKNGAHIVTDTNMAKAGINKKRLAGYGGEVHCFMAA
ncbi:MAG TPA: precorrin-8X methylmutase, partial [Bacteroides sp.]|nr:precorrin-8X methylmutase [Bacteroides sp.]